MATGMVLVIVMRHIDLSVGSIIGFVSTIIGVAQVHILPVYLGLDNPAIWIIAVVIALALGAAIGAFHGSLVAYLGIPAFIVTLGAPIVLARRGVVGDDRPDHRAARRPLRPDGRRTARLDRRHGELGARRARLRGHRLRPLRRPAAAGALPLPAAADVGRIYDRRRRLPGRRRRDRGHERLSLARARRRALRGGAPHSRAGRRPVHFDRLRDSGADRAGDRRRDDLPRAAHALRPLRLRDRRQSGSGRTRRHQHQDDHGAGVRADGHARRRSRPASIRRASTRRPTCSASSTSST